MIIACFEGDVDIIRFFIEVSLALDHSDEICFSSHEQNGADPNQTESEHHLTPIHVLCDAEYHGQSLRVSRSI